MCDLLVLAVDSLVYAICTLYCVGFVTIYHRPFLPPPSN
ncbi:hypothetical protein AG1IA_00759 [Rhizoctonia solani AG-1 IA]|uniref:Uncharacterized protein n=1 Tax=Thanatephorus cucumeris (strain AG1-IA) TaxID=983506 RepID=L8X4T2_THACA|nr:hypothetical protein AG1IA_00759 [Rhizoctonia solani AG-1 IA]